jgi:hypothetical protein
LPEPTDWRSSIPCARETDAPGNSDCDRALIPFMLPYYHASATVGLGRSLEETARYSAKWTDYLAAPGRVLLRLVGQTVFSG